jgi:RimJ/RimL family protein N-acetyltransferase
MISSHIETSRLQMDILASSDQSFILELLNTEGFIKFIGDRQVRSSSDADVYVKKIMGDPHITYWIVRLKEATQAMGIVSLIKRDYLPHHDIGFAFLPRFEKKGYALEAATAVLAKFLDAYPESKILANPFPENVQSIQLLTRLGLHFEREMEMEGQVEAKSKKCHIYCISKDQFLINDVTKKFYSAFSTINGQVPNWHLLEHLCLPTVLFNNTHDVGFDVTNFVEFMAPRKIKLTDGSLVNFEEYEIQSETKVTQSIAQRYSQYAKRGILNGRSFQRRGEKFIQFIKIHNAWKINSVLWEDESTVPPMS